MEHEYESTRPLKPHTQYGVMDFKPIEAKTAHHKPISYIKGHDAGDVYDHLLQVLNTVELFSSHAYKHRLAPEESASILDSIAQLVRGQLCELDELLGTQYVVAGPKGAARLNKLHEPPMPGQAGAR